MSAALLVSVLGGSLGLAIGSFLNVVVWRVPRGESLIAPPSACPRCAHPIRARDNVPVASWLLLRGRCRDCAEPIRARYPLVEAATALAFVALTLYYVLVQPSRFAELPALLFLAATSISLALIDADTHTLPNRIVLPAYRVGAALLLGATVVAGDWAALATAFIGASALFAFYLALALVHPRGMGLGDVKLAGVLGLYLGWFGWSELVVGAFAAFLLGGVYAVVLLATRQVERGGGVPFGPWMLAGAWVGILLGERIAHTYLTSVGLASVGLTSVGLPFAGLE
jgi:leader peptidase (prepilin peptidase)/N-methyltransferase